MQIMSIEIVDLKDFLKTPWLITVYRIKVNNFLKKVNKRRVTLDGWSTHIQCPEK